MFTYTIDKKPTIKDRNGNILIDFIQPLFKKNSVGVQDYMVRRIDSEKYAMRPDLVSFAMYGSDEYTEYILKFSGISNPFTLCGDDVLKIPNNNEAYGMMAVNSPADDKSSLNSKEAVIRNSFKYHDPELNAYTKDGQSYRDLKNKKIPSGIIDAGKITNKTGRIMVPYISEDGKTAVTIRNGYVYFGEDSGLNIAGQNTVQQATNITSAIQSAIDNTVTKLSDSNCLYNGTNLADFVRSNFNK